MIPLFTDEEFKNAKSRSFLPIQCDGCRKPITRLKHNLMDYKNTKRRRYCTHQCQQLHDYPPQYIPCKTCGTIVRATIGRIKQSKSKNVFCSSYCSGKYSSTHRTHGYRISQIELWIQKKLSELFPTLEIIYNSNQIINRELDIYIPSMKKAIEINGIHHYLPIFGEEHLQHQKSIDCNKQEKCLQNQINLLVIDISKQQCFTEKSSIPYLDEIVKFIQLN